MTSLSLSVSHAQVRKLNILVYFSQGGEFSGERKSDIHERQRLIQLVHLQAQEVEALKEEITLLSRKGGHILPPAQPPLPPSAQQRASIPNT